MHIYVSIGSSIYSSTKIVRHENPNESPSRLSIWQDSCMKQHRLTKSVFLLIRVLMSLNKVFSCGGFLYEMLARVMLGLLTLLFPSYVMWIYSKCHFSVSFLEYFCVFECYRDKNIWLLLQLLKGRNWSRFHGVLYKMDLKSLCNSWWSDSCFTRISGSFHKVWRFLPSPRKGRSLLLMREQAFVSYL